MFVCVCFSAWPVLWEWFGLLAGWSLHMHVVVKVSLTYAISGDVSDVPYDQKAPFCAS